MTACPLKPPWNPRTEGSKVALRLSVEGMRRGQGLGVEPTGNKVRFECMSIARVENGKIAEGWNIFDQLGPFTQLGVIPKNSGPTDSSLPSPDR